MEDRENRTEAADTEVSDELFGGLARELEQINEEAEASMFDGFVGKVFVWLRRHRKWVVTALLIPLLNFGYEYYLYWTEFPVVPEIITEEEFHLLVEYADVINAEAPYPTVSTEVSTGGRTLKTYRMYDTDDDGVGDIYIGLIKHGHLKTYGWRTETNADGEREVVYFEEPWEPQALEADSGIFRVHWLDVLLKKEPGFGVGAEDVFLDDHTGSLHIVVKHPKDEMHTEIRAQIERMLAIAEAAKAAGVQPDKSQTQGLPDLTKLLKDLNNQWEKQNEAGAEGA